MKKTNVVALSLLLLAASCGKQESGIGEKKNQPVEEVVEEYFPIVEPEELVSLPQPDVTKEDIENAEQEAATSTAVPLTAGHWSEFFGAHETSSNIPLVMFQSTFLCGIAALEGGAKAGINVVKGVGNIFKGTLLASAELIRRNGLVIGALLGNQNDRALLSQAGANDQKRIKAAVEIVKGAVPSLLMYLHASSSKFMNLPFRQKVVRACNVFAGLGVDAALTIAGFNLLRSARVGKMASALDKVDDVAAKVGIPTNGKALTGVNQKMLPGSGSATLGSNPKMLPPSIPRPAVTELGRLQAFAYGARKKLTGFTRQLKKAQQSLVKGATQPKATTQSLVKQLGKKVKETQQAFSTAMQRLKQKGMSFFSRGKKDVTKASTTAKSNANQKAILGSQKSLPAATSKIPVTKINWSSPKEFLSSMNKDTLTAALEQLLKRCQTSPAACAEGFPGTSHVESARQILKNINMVSHHTHPKEVSHVLHQIHMTIIKKKYYKL